MANGNPTEWLSERKKEDGPTRRLDLQVTAETRPAETAASLYSPSF